MAPSEFDGLPVALSWSLQAFPAPLAAATTAAGTHVRNVLSGHPVDAAAVARGDTTIVAPSNTTAVTPSNTTAVAGGDTAAVAPGTDAGTGTAAGAAAAAAADLAADGGLLGQRGAGLGTLQACVAEETRLKRRQVRLAAADLGPQQHAVGVVARFLVDSRR